MIFWYTGQPGHGKTLHALDHALTFRDQGRLVYAGNVRGLKHDQARFLPITPAEFCDWMNFLPDGAVCLIDEAYEAGMLPKRAPGSKVPLHVQELAKHRHRGIDFIFVSQSPAKQIDEFVHDLIERHVHVRRRFGLPFAHLRTFDRFERNPEKAKPLTLKRVKLPKRPMGLYESTVLDTTEKSIPWYYFAALALLVFIGWLSWTMMHRVTDQLTTKVGTVTGVPATEKGTKDDGARATADAVPIKSNLRETDYVAWLTPRIGGQPWTAPAYDSLDVPPSAPRLFCGLSQSGDDAQGEYRASSCTCITDQGTRHAMERKRCEMIARQGQYEPFRDENLGDRQRLDDSTQRRQMADREGGAGVSPAAMGGTPVLSSVSVIEGKQISGYGDMGARDLTAAP